MTCVCVQLRVMKCTLPEKFTINYRVQTMHVHGSAVTVLTRVHYKKSHIIACALQHDMD